MNYENQDPDDNDRKRDSSRKRDGKKEKKEKPYQRFEEEDSDEDQLMLAEDLKSPSKNKKDKIKPSFKFPIVKKEKAKEKEEKKDKDSKKEEKEKRREEKGGLKKLKKDKKKSKHTPAPAIITPSQYENPVFGVPLAVAVERNKSHDGIEVPAVVRECIDYIEECGLSCEGIYRISGVKSKVQHLKDAYNRHEDVYLYEHEPNVVASLLKLFLRDLPEPVLTPVLLPRFEEASVIKNIQKKVEAFHRLICDLPTCNRLLLSWMIVHMTHVIALARENKMSLQNVSIVLSPTMQISHRVLYVLFSNVDNLFGNVILRKYVPPLKPAHSKWSLELPDNVASLEEELSKQESLLHQLHVDLNCGLTDPVKEEQLWEVQRVVTQLKRKIKMAKKNVESGQRRKANLDMKRSSQTSIPSLSAPEELDLRPATIPTATPPASHVTTVAAVVETIKPAEAVESTPIGKDPSPAPGTTLLEEAKKAVKFASEPSKDKKDSQSVDNQSSGKEPGVSKVKINISDQENTNIHVKDKAPPKEKVEEISKTSETAPNDVKITDESSNTVKEPAETPQKPAMRKDIKPAERPPSITGQRKSSSISPPGPMSPTFVKEVTLPQKTVKLPESLIVQKPPPSAASPSPNKFLPNETREVSSSEPKETPPSTKTATPPPSLPPFMSTTLLQPVKAHELPTKPAVSAEDLKVKQENQLRWEKLRELEEELLGDKKNKTPKVSETESENEEEIVDDGKRDIGEILEEEYALKLEEEELIAIAEELKQKMATEQSEMERLTQEIQELQYLRQDSDLEDLSSSSSDSEDSEDEDDLHDLLTTLIQDNQALELHNADFCQKIHEERMICLSVKLQIRLLQQKQQAEATS